MNKIEFEEIMLHGYKIHIYENKLKFYKRDNTMENYDFKSICDRLTQYLISEAFIPKKSFKIEMVTLVPKTAEPKKPLDTKL